jgi:hypothetical protein
MKRIGQSVVLAGSLGTLLLFCDVMSAQTAKISGLITGRNAANMTV